MMRDNELRHLQYMSINKFEGDDVQEQIKRLTNENCVLRKELDDLQIICEYLRKENRDLVELLYDARKYIKENRL